ncbi:hypothetical protein M092_1586 [Parabacteroides distasonis str. 3776 D15 iv]|nr:hypothetical protein M090_2206 [Parabacteroides distasonis str. 3776 Po2 i]KDS72828.1 hypothetical protein M092_1586 [Parabacteroides distasonis str. 3776 D15 iv]
MTFCFYCLYEGIRHGKGVAVFSGTTRDYRDFHNLIVLEFWL